MKEKKGGEREKRTEKRERHGREREREREGDGREREKREERQRKETEKRNRQRHTRQHSRVHTHTHKVHKHRWYLSNIRYVLLEDRFEEGHKIQELGVVEISVPWLDRDAVVFLQHVTVRIGVDDNHVA
jgi:hypothetical protein